MPLNEITVKSLKPTDKARKVSDAKGLYLFVAPTGSKLWRYDYRHDGKRKTMSFGAWPKVSLATARGMRDVAKASIGDGTNLQFGGHLAAWFGPTFSLELWQQANMRLPRPGQKHQVYIYPIIARGTYDERAMEVLQDKDATQDRIIQNFLYNPTYPLVV